MRQVAQKEEKELLALQSSFDDVLTSETLHRFKAELQETAQREFAGIIIAYVYCTILLLRIVKCTTT